MFPIATGLIEPAQAVSGQNLFRCGLDPTSGFQAYLSPDVIPWTPSNFHEFHEMLHPGDFSPRPGNDPASPPLRLVSALAQREIATLPEASRCKDSQRYI